MGEGKYDPPVILGRPFLSTVKAIIYIGTGEVHMHLPSDAAILLTLTISLKTLSRSGQEEDDATTTRRGKSSRTDRQTTKEKW